MKKRTKKTESLKQAIEIWEADMGSRLKAITEQNRKELQEHIQRCWGDDGYAEQWLKDHPQAPRPVNDV